MMSGSAREQSIIVLEDHPAIQTFPRHWPLEWQPSFVVRLMDQFRPGQHPLYQKGAFYSLDFSSVFSASAMLAIPEPPKRILDLCSAPGGKAIFAFRAFKPELLACNETIRKRTGTLIANLSRCKVVNSAVWSADPSVYAKRAPKAFDLVIVDAPCSGQSLMAKGDPAPGAFTPHLIDMCVGRQRRITGMAAQTLRGGGHLLYSTCTFSEKENEKVISWLVSEYPFLEPVPVPHLAEFQSKYADFPCYRLFPQSGLGAGAFVCLLRHTEEAPAHYEPVDIPFTWQFGEPSEFEPAPPPRPKKPEEKPYVRRTARYIQRDKKKRGRRK